ncbi:MAG TPA: flagellar motor switch protein FliG [Desulfatiglandales bacterium]|nr:flagellar motor switch protein FliG [Desulfatiglandales bacterium]
MAIEKLDYNHLTGPKKAAILLLAMGEEFTTSFFKELDEGSIKRIGRHMTEISFIPSDVMNAVMEEFLKNFRSDVNLTISGRELLQKVINKTLDEKTAREVFKVIGNKNANVPFSDLAYMPSETLLNLIKGEHPQTVALIISHLPQEKAAEIINILPEETKLDIALRIVKMGQVQDELIRELDESMKKDISGVGIVSRRFDGVEKLAEILNEVDNATEELILSYIEKEDSEIAEKVRQKMFVFEDLMLTEDRSFREILQNVDNQVVTKALKTASEEMKQKIFNNLSERASEMLKEDMEVMGPVRLKEVEEAQQTMIRTAKKLEAEGRIVLVGKGKEEIFV